MNIDYNLISFIDLLALVQGFIMGIILIISNRKSRPSFLLGLFLITYSLELINSILIDTGITKQMPNLFLLPIYFYFTSVPLFYLYAKSLTQVVSLKKGFSTLFLGILAFLIFLSLKGLIMDVRQNTGGDPSLATKFASYLTDKEIYTGFERFKTGPAVGDFSDSKVYLQPTESDNKYLKPVMVLTDRYCYSATTTFAYSVNPLEQVTFVGQRTGGGSGSVADGYLTNGWKWSLSTSEFIDHLDRHLDNGFEPDISVALDTFDLAKDEVIERAIWELQ